MAPPCQTGATVAIHARRARSSSSSTAPALLVVVHPSSERTVNPCAKTTPLPKKQECHPALLLVVPSGRGLRTGGGARIRGEGGASKVALLVPAAAQIRTSGDPATEGSIVPSLRYDSQQHRICMALLTCARSRRLGRSKPSGRWARARRGRRMDWPPASRRVSARCRSILDDGTGCARTSRGVSRRCSRASSRVRRRPCRLPRRARRAPRMRRSLRRGRRCL